MGNALFSEKLNLARLVRYLVWSLTALFISSHNVYSAPAAREAAPSDFVSLADIAPAVKIDMKYAGSDNFTGRPVPGYEANKCLLTRPAARALREAQDWLSKFHLQLQVYDCYRPQRAVTAFVNWAADSADTVTKETHYPKVPKDHLFGDGYIATKSGHSRGSTVDIGIVDLDAGTPFDFFDPSSHTAAAGLTPSQRAARALLSAALERVGFVNYDKEWWHFSLKAEPHPKNYYDVPVR
ncbi:MAG: M15 family metallopeptidase [Deltaproteobacteria bacterium]|nr:M15 family metallopeptidase [Deltaproteobacteria bacterium]